MQIYISRNDEQFGPYSREELTSCLEQGSLTLEDFAWHEELADWKRLGELIQVPAPPNESQRGELARQTLHVPAFEKISGRSLPAPSASPERISGRYHFAKIAILLLLIAGGGYYYLGYGGGKVAARHWIENAVGLYHRLGSRQAPVHDQCRHADAR